MALTQGQVNTFKGKGFFVIKGFFNPSEVAQISAWLDELRDKQPASGEEAKYYEISPISDENILVRIENVIGDHNRVASDLLISDKTEDCLAQLLGEAPLLFKEKVNYKLPGCRPDQLHQDQAAGWNTYCDFFITMGIAVDENRLDNGALSFMCSGNYKRALMTEEWQPLTEADPPYEPADEYVLLEADPGDVIFFDCYVPHGSPANTGSRSRRNVFLTFNRASDGDMRARYYHDKWQSYPPNQAQEARTKETFRV
ncbi:MAG: phytanoyl-CoA dioxygenase family protein [Alphaproteobacteria bacterium]|jgi:ectoine hydroxylase-related dioxygenase (phytanoyl-CoA dioxygenase family)|nr:phytanoyl-CoA dioxygenase family protein [Alphaproteobacteria bacterium]MDP7172781.1 phytanoyl-CoA dioxygenase family protein [Alphaproteobacteria bacterium]MDP7233122.1 phytanoyl-CoA dioxygenase family protein [Alphaproteobacteria bacterium]MDP7488442.1 phytanoyl-CoA dioxygenase family protein [Alphaproteobacteria bacterium]|tara:strand:- start:485 stop:1252 length:768 start_codon:yes stop_codon:yes gene_type:complete